MSRVSPPSRVEQPHRGKVAILGRVEAPHAHAVHDARREAAGVQFAVDRVRTEPLEEPVVRLVAADDPEVAHVPGDGGGHAREADPLAGSRLGRAHRVDLQNRLGGESQVGEALEGEQGGGQLHGTRGVEVARGARGPR